MTTAAPTFFSRLGDSLASVTLLVSLLLGLLTSTSAQAQVSPEPETIAHDPVLIAEVQRFKPEGDGQEFFHSGSARALGAWQPSFGMVFNYAYRPLVISPYRFGHPEESKVQAETIRHHTTADIQAALEKRTVDG